MTIVLCGGGSGGHITPLLAVAAELRRRHKGAKLIYVGERGGKFTHITEGVKLFDERHYISAGKLRRYHGESFLTRLFDVKTNFLNLIDCFRLLAGSIQSYILLRKLKPGAVFLKGGFVCVPVAAVAKIRGIPYITHDSDALPGLSNRIAGRWAEFHATAQPAQYYSYPQDKIRVTGVPTDHRFRVYSKSEQSILREKYGFGAHSEVLLVTGGSNGARRLNATIVEILPRLLKEFPNLRVLHQIGEGNGDQVASISDNTEVKKRVTFFDFSSELFHMSAISDLVVTRAGASIIADLARQLKACVIVPNPYLTGGHQMKNAKVFADADAAVVVTEAEMLENSSNLYNAVKELLQNDDRRVELARNLHSLTPNENAASAIASLLEEIAQ